MYLAIGCVYSKNNRRLCLTGALYLCGRFIRFIRKRLQGKGGHCLRYYEIQKHTDLQPESQQTIMSSSNTRAKPCGGCSTFPHHNKKALPSDESQNNVSELQQTVLRQQEQIKTLERELKQAESDGEPNRVEKVYFEVASWSYH